MKKHEAILLLIEEFLQSENQALQELKREIRDIGEGELSDELKDRLVTLQEYFGGFAEIPKKKKVIKNPHLLKEEPVRRPIKHVVREQDEQTAEMFAATAMQPLAPNELYNIQQKLSQLKTQKGI